jgi:xylan 1,4-beta-xylosidase
MRKTLLFVLTLMTPVVALVHANPDTTPISRHITADLGRVEGPNTRMAEFCVGAGRANEGLRADWQRQLTRVRQELGFRYIRFHGLFCDDMGVYFEDKAGRPIYNWQYIDELFDFLHRIGMKPFVELGFMPSGMASGSQTIFWWRGNVTLPRDIGKWADFVSAFVQHCRERYGPEEVRSWYFEVWNEPNLSGFFAGKQEDYFRLYDATALAVKRVDASLRVGGPATAGNGWIQETLDHCVRNQVPIDFISTHSYGTMSGYLDEFGNAGTVLAPDRNAITDGVRWVREAIRKSPLPGLELHYTEWSSSYTPADPVHDSYHSASYILDKIRNIGADADSMSYWTFTDIFEEPGPRATPFHGGFGLLNYQDIPKASYYVYKYLNRLGKQRLACGDEASLVCAGSDGGVQALFWDFTITHPGPSVNNQEFYLRDLPPARSGSATLSLSGLKPGRYALVFRRVGYRANDSFASYRDLGSPAQLTPQEVSFLREANDDRPVLCESVVVGDDGRFERAFELRENDACLVTLEPLRPGLHP